MRFRVLKESVTKLNDNEFSATMKDGTKFRIWKDTDAGYRQSNVMYVAYVGDNWIDENDKIISKNLLGYLQFSVPDDDEDSAYVQMIEVADRSKRQGVGTALIKALQMSYKNIHYGYSTEDGSKLLKALGITESKKKRKKKDVTKGSFGFFQTLTGGDVEKAMNQFNNAVDFGGVTADGGSAVSEDVENIVVEASEYEKKGYIYARYDEETDSLIIPKDEWEDWD